MQFAISLKINRRTYTDFDRLPSCSDELIHVLHEKNVLTS